MSVTGGDTPGEVVAIARASVAELMTLRAGAARRGAEQEAAMIAFAGEMVERSLARDEILSELSEAHWPEDSSEPPPAGGESAHHELMARLEAHVCAAMSRKAFEIARQRVTNFIAENGRPDGGVLPFWEIEDVSEAVAWGVDLEDPAAVVDALKRAAAAEGLGISAEGERDAIRRARHARAEWWPRRPYFFSEEAEADREEAHAWDRAFDVAEALIPGVVDDPDALSAIAAEVAVKVPGLAGARLADAVVTAASMSGLKLGEGAYAAAETAASVARRIAGIKPPPAKSVSPWMAALVAAPAMLTSVGSARLAGALIERFGLTPKEAEEIAAATIADAEAEAARFAAWKEKRAKEAAPRSPATAEDAEAVAATTDPAPAVVSAEDAAQDVQAQAEAACRAAVGVPPAASAIPHEDDLVEDALDLNSGESLEALTYPPGFVGDLIDWMVSSSESPSRPLALGPALALTGALAGRRYQSDRELRTNLYIVALAPSGYGKDHSRKAVKHYCEKGGFKQHLGPARVMSASALRNIVKAKPSCVTLVDEYGGFMQQITDARAGIHNSMIKNDLLELFTSASTSFEGAEFAGQAAETIYAPNFGIYGTSTPDDFWSKLGSLNALDGLLSRHILINVQGDPPAEVTPTCAPSHVPPHLIEAGQRILDEVKIGNLAGLATAGIPKARTVPYSEAARDVLATFKAKVKRQAESMGPAERAALQRTVEHAIKLALVVAVGERPERPEISASTLEWGCRLAWHSTCSLINEMRDRIADGRREADFNRLLRLIKDAGAEGLPPSRVTDLTRGMDRRTREDILRDLQETGRVKLAETPGKNGRGRKRQRYVATGRAILS